MTPFKRRFGKYFYAWLYHLSAWRETSTNNYGFHPVDPDVQAAAGDEAHQIQLYREMARAVPDAEWPSLRALEVGCGRGGGLVQLELLLRPREMVGLDFAGRAVAFASKLARRLSSRATFLRGDALQLPFPAERFDVVMNVESSHIYADQGRFLREVARVLRPGGRLLIADYRARAGGLATLHADLAAAGFRVASEREVTEQVIAACRADTARRLKLLEAGPRFARAYLSEYAMVDGSRELERFNSLWHYFIVLAEKGGPGSAAP